MNTQVPEHVERGGKAFLKEMELALRNMESTTVKLRESLLSMESLEMLYDALRTEDDAYRDNRSRAGFEEKLLGLSVREEGCIVRISIPALLPHRRSKPECMVAGPLLDMLQKFLDNGGGAEFRKKSGSGVLLVVSQSYRTPWMVKDNDNIELKVVIDTLVLSGLVSGDRGDNLSLLSTASVEGRDNCDLILIPKSVLDIRAEGLKLEI